MHTLRNRLVLLSVLLGLAGLFPRLARAAEADPPAAPELTESQQKALKPLLEEFDRATRAQSRVHLLARMIAVSPDTAGALLAMIDEQLRADRQTYVELLAPRIAAAYAKRLGRLTDREIYQALMTRRLWQQYVVATSSQTEFRTVYLKPCEVMAGTILPKLTSIRDRRLAALRRRLLEFGAYQAKCRSLLGVDADPTKTKVSPTGIPYPPLDTPPTFENSLDYLERTLVLAHSVAPPGARKVLMMDAEAAGEIDVQEAEFVMYANTVRMLVGSVVWRVDPLMCACARDHSNDRKEGRASGHSSTVPGKEGFVKRLKRFGSWGRSEGAGGGKSGVAYIRGLSYGGGHTGPLYATRRNVVGVGGRRGAFTSIYRTEKNLLHPCPAVDDEIFMPPGVQREELTSRTLRSIYQALHDERFEAAGALIAEAEVDNERERMILRFFSISIQVELDWCFEGITHIAKAGDVQEVRRRLTDAAAAFGQLPAFRKRADRLEMRMGKEDLTREIANGERLRKLLKASCNAASLTQFIADVGEASVYAKAAQWSLDQKPGEGQNGLDPLAFFLTRDKGLKRYGYPGPWK